LAYLAIGNKKDLKDRHHLQNGDQSLAQNGHVSKNCAESLKVGMEEYGEQMQRRFRQWKIM
jgi:hypothetical protein